MRREVAVEGEARVLVEQRPFYSLYGSQVLPRWIAPVVYVCWNDYVLIRVSAVRINLVLGAH